MRTKLRLIGKGTIDMIILGLGSGILSAFVAAAAALAMGMGPLGAIAAYMLGGSLGFFLTALIGLHLQAPRHVGFAARSA